MRGYRGFANTICKSWHLPCIPETYGPDIERTFRIDPRTLSNAPELIIPDALKTWGPGGARVLFVTDNKTLASLLNGRSALSDDSYRPVFIKMIRCIALAVRLGWKPLRDECDFFRWVPREFNTIADHLANIALDTRANWSEPMHDIDDFDYKRDSLLFYSDGGFRDNQMRSAAAGIAVFRVTGAPLELHCICAC